MSLRPANLLILGSSALVIACMVGLALAALPLLPFQQQWARQHWQQRGPHHYELEVEWANGMNYGHARVEIRDNRLVRGTDLDTGLPLSASKQVSAGYFGSIDNLFNLIDSQARPSPSWRTQLARIFPPLASRLDNCAAPLPIVHYSADFGYPTDIDYNDSWCVARFFNRSSIKIAQFRPLQ